MRISSSIALALILCGSLSSQSYTSYFTGDINDVSTSPLAGTCLMGGASEHDEAMIWFLERADGGDVLVLRASGSDGYNSYFYSQLGVAINSVETIVFNSSSASSDPYVLQQIANAEAIWFAGGDQWDYVSYWRGNEAGELLRDHILVKQAPIGGTSAGMAILGQSYFTAENGTITSAAALNNPFSSNMTIASDDFLPTPFLEACITDTHYDDPDRRGRHMSFLARMSTSSGALSFGIACDEYTSVCIDENGIARAYGYSPTYDDNVYFLKVDCEGEFLPEVCESGSPLTWDRENAAVKVYHIEATEEGDAYLDLNDWHTGEGGVWENWWVDSGALFTAPGSSTLCPTELTDISSIPMDVFPNPGSSMLNMENLGQGAVLSLFDLSGRTVDLERVSATTYDTSSLPNGTYIIQIDQEGNYYRTIWIKE